MQTPLISIIIPVYNVEKYLSECLDSVIAQTYQNWEAICVDDGSTDNSLKILKEYAEKDNRIKIIIQENQGTSIARKHAINTALGSWIAYLDADDFVSDKYLERLYRCSCEKKSDVVFCYYNEYTFGEIKKHKKKIKKKYIQGIGKIEYITGACKIIKKELFEKIIFPEKCCYGEDSSISMQISLQHPKIVIIPEYLYYYRRHESSVVLSQSSVYKQIISILNGYEAIENFIRNNEKVTDKQIYGIRNQLQKRIYKIIKGSKL